MYVGNAFNARPIGMKIMVTEDNRSPGDTPPPENYPERKFPRSTPVGRLGPGRTPPPGRSGVRVIASFHNFRFNNVAKLHGVSSRGVSLGV